MVERVTRDDNWVTLRRTGRQTAVRFQTAAGRTADSDRGILVSTHPTGRQCRRDLYYTYYTYLGGGVR